MSNVQDNFRGVKNDAKDRLAGDFDQLKSGFQQLKSDVSTILSNAMGASKSSAQGGVEAARGQANAAVDKAREGYEDLKSKGTDQFEQIGDLISERPMASALVAFGVGFVLAKVLTRR